MPQPRQGPKHLFVYINERGDRFLELMTDYVAFAGGFDLADALDAAQLGGLPPHAVMRHVGLLDLATNLRYTQPIADAGNALYNEGGTANRDGTDMVVTGRIGEKWPFPHF